MARRRVRRGARRSRGGSGSVLMSLVVLVLLVVVAWGQQFLDSRTSAPTGPGTVAVQEFWVEPEAGLGPVAREMRSARTSLDVVVYLLTYREVISEMVAAHKRGVQVRVMVEESPFGGGLGNGPALEQLKAAKVPWKYGHPTFRFTHEKAIIVDRKRALVMTANLTKSAFTRNREYIALITSAEEVADIQKLFDADWDRRQYTLRSASLVVSDVNSRVKLLELIEQARQQLEIEAEVMADKEIRAALVAAQERGVRVRVVMSPPEPEETTCDGLRELFRGGVWVRLVSSPYIHSKSMLVDGQRAYVGSINFTATSMEQNRELGIITSTPSVLRELQQTFELDWSDGDEFRGTC